MIEYIKDNCNKTPLVGVEVGVWDGSNALNILKNLDMKMLYLVDPWKRHRIYNNRLFRQDKMDIVLMKAVARLISFEDKWHMVRKNSISGANHVPDNLDFVYIDAQHTYNNCRSDIAVWHPKIKHNGLLGGHDYNVGVTEGVVDAVDEFVEREDLKLFLDELDWWIVKK